MWKIGVRGVCGARKFIIFFHCNSKSPVPRTLLELCLCTVRSIFVQHLFVQRLFIQIFPSNPFRPILLGQVRLGLDEKDWTKSFRWKGVGRKVGTRKQYMLIITNMHNVSCFCFQIQTLMAYQIYTVHKNQLILKISFVWL